MKTFWTVNAIYNYEAKKYNEAVKALEQYNNYKNTMDDYKEKYIIHKEEMDNLKKFLIL